ncbi:hypothetical protein EG329_004887 [Mollisiaceae sp. DMI_Dod_QoI]|nr:hypothetical protein EG329_004887 [Helotiales sp. DMI_Dod_QoI]
MARDALRFDRDKPKLFLLALDSQLNLTYFQLFLSVLIINYYLDIMVHADSSNFKTDISKEDAYKQVLEQAEALFEGQGNWVWYV